VCMTVPDRKPSAVAVREDDQQPGENAGEKLSGPDGAQQDGEDGPDGIAQGRSSDRRTASCCRRG